MQKLQLDRFAILAMTEKLCWPARIGRLSSLMSHGKGTVRLQCLHRMGTLNMKAIRVLGPLLLTAAFAASPSAAAAPIKSEFITLGTKGGPIPDARRSQPANLLRYDGENILIDAGDGVSEQLAKIGVPLGQVRTIFLSHLHFDHTGGLFALLGLRYQVRSRALVTIYGPVGTKRMVEGLLAAMEPESEIGGGYPGTVKRAPANLVRVIEIGDGSQVKLGRLLVSSVTNTHYSFPEGSVEASRSQSLSFRFDLPDRSILYTGDTGPSAKVERLAHGADLLVSEVIEPDFAMPNLKQNEPDLPPEFLAQIAHHFAEQHLSPDQAGILAQHAGVKKLVFTHAVIADGEAHKVTAAAASHFKGPIVVARDLDRF
jgi:ribonuclease BN (tRNA processing enzyme)